MKKMDLIDIQKISMCILSDVHNFCVSNNINYSLAYGTLIGAKRHKGFIPWDDDIDIVMLRPDYERFCKEYTSDNCKIIPPSDSYINYARVCDVIKTKYKTASPWTSQKDLGIWIDVFPIDSVEDDKLLFSQRIDRLKPLLDLQVNTRMARNGILFTSQLRPFLSVLIRKIKYSKYNLSDIQNKIDKIVSEIPFGSTNHCSQLVCRGNGDKEFFTLDMFSSFCLTKFENYEFMIAKGWHDILLLNYGDYMKLPPLEEQKPHGGFVSFYWR